MSYFHSSAGVLIMRVFRKLLISSAILLCGLSAPATHAADPIVELLFWGEISSAAGKGVQNYQKLHSELGLMKSEIARLSAELENCNTCDRQRIEAELETWQGTYSTYQTFTGSVLSQMGYDANVMRFFGVDSPGAFTGLSATGQKDYIDFDALPEPDWLADAGPMCKRIYEQQIACSKAWQEAGSPRRNACEELDRLSFHCSNGEVAEAEEYMAILSLRRAGVPIPEVTDVAGSLTVDYGRTTPGVNPKVPLGWQMYDYLMTDRTRNTVSYTLERGGGAGILTGAYYKRFHPSDLRPFRNNCSRAGEASPAYCEELLKYRHSRKENGYIGAPVLQCDYSRKNPGSLDRVIFWLYRKPSFAGLVASVDKKDGDMAIANFCPRLYSDAIRMQNGRLTPERLAIIDYSVDIRTFAEAHDLPSETTYTPMTVSTRITGYLDGIEAASLSTEEFEKEAERRQNSRGSTQSISEDIEQDTEELAALSQENADDASIITEPDAAADNREQRAAGNMDILGLEIGVAREDAMNLLQEAIGGVQASVEVKPIDEKEMFRNNLHLVGEDGSLLILGFDGPDDDAILMGALRIVAHERTEDLVNALVQKYAHWEPEVDNYGGVHAGESRCAAGHANMAGGIAQLRDVRTNLHVARVTKTVLTQRFNEVSAQEWMECSQAMRTKLFDDYFVTTIVDMDLVQRTFASAKSSEPKPKTPKL